MRLSGILLLFLLCNARAHSQVLEGAYTKKAQFHYKNGADFMAKADYDRAISEFNTAISYDATLSDAYLDRASARKATGDWNGANTDLSIYLELIPDQPEALFERGTVRYVLGLYTLARADFIAVRNHPPGETARVFYQMDAHGRVNDIFTTQGGISASLYNYLGLIAFKLADYNSSVAYYDSALAKNPSNPDYYINSALSYEALNDEFHAMESYAEALKLDPDNAMVRYNLGIAASKSGNPGKARKYFDDAIAQDPGRPEMYSERAYIRLMNNDVDGANVDYTKAIQLNPKDAENWFNRGLCREKLENYSEAYSDFSNALTIDEHFDRGWLERGNVLLKMSKFREAIDDYSAALLYRPDYGLAFYNRAVAYQRLDETEHACADLVRAVELGVEPARVMQQKVCIPK